MESFDLSGAYILNDSTLLVISDDEDAIFSLQSKSNELKNYVRITSDKYYDLEAIVICDGDILVSGEFQHSLIYKLDSNQLKPLSIDYLQKAESIKYWGNKAIEGLACDCSTNTLYFVKERSPKTLLKMNSKTHEVTPIQLTGPLSETELNNDISDLKFEYKHGQPFLYILQRRDCSIARLNLISGEVAIRSFEKYVRDKNGFQEVYANTREERKYGIGEALVLFPDEMWIGVDNNDNKINLHYKLANRYALDGAMPIFFKFKRGDF